MSIENDEDSSPPQKAVTKRRVPAVTRAIAILRFLAKESEPIGIVPLARGVGLVPSTCLHITRVLVDEGLVAISPGTKRYTLGSGILSLASAYSRRNVLAKVVGNRLDHMSKEYGFVFAAVEVSSVTDYVVVGVGATQTGFSVSLTVGTRFPIFVSASGRCWAAFGPSADKLHQKRVRKQVESVNWEEPPSFDTWISEVELVKKHGYAVDVGNFIRGVTVVAVPVFNELGAMVGCLAALGLREHLVEEKLQKVIVGLKGLSNQVNFELGHEVLDDDG